jgi:hypothetical protein
VLTSSESVRWVQALAGNHCSWGYDITEVCDGYRVWSMAYDQWLWNKNDGWYFPEQDPNAIKVQ